MLCVVIHKLNCTVKNTEKIVVGRQWVFYLLSSVTLPGANPIDTVLKITVIFSSFGLMPVTVAELN